MKEYVFFVKKRTLRLQRKSVKIAEKVQRAPIFLQKGLANRLPDVVTLRWISKSNAIGMINYSIKLQNNVVDGAAVEGLGVGECEGESALLCCSDAFHDDEVLVVFVCHLQRIAGGEAARHAPVFFLCFLAGRVGVGEADDIGLSVDKMDGEHLPQFVVVEHEAAGLLHEVHPAGTSADGVEMGNLVFAQRELRLCCRRPCVHQRTRESPQRASYCLLRTMQR